MRVLRTIPEVRAAVREARTAGRSVGLVPTMGAFHEGHLSLMRAARREHDLVVVSLFVNPTQFAVTEDLGAYPRTEARDLELADSAGADVVFVPTADEMYPRGFATSIHIDGITEVLCGASRGASHFDGVATIVAKLFQIVAPDAAYFGQKDAQQVLVVRRLVLDLDMPVRIVACPIVREPDGLAMSSRNAYLDPESRQRAAALSRALDAAERAVAAGRTEASDVLAAARRVLDEAGIDPEYLELRSPDDLAELTEVSGPSLLAVAAQVGPARLIDNRTLGEGR